MAKPEIVASKPPATEPAVARLEKRLKSKLPASYRQFLLRHNGGQPQPLGRQFLQPTLQLHELRFAVGSPVCRTDEDEHRALRPHDRLQRPRRAVLILEAELRHALAHLRSQLGHIDLLLGYLQSHRSPRRRMCEQQRQTETCVSKQLHGIQFYYSVPLTGTDWK